MNGIQCVYTAGDKGLIRLCWNEFMSNVIIGIRTWECFGEWSLAVQHQTCYAAKLLFIYYCKC